MCKSKCCLAVLMFCFINSGSVIADELKQSKTSVLVEVAETIDKLEDSLVKLADNVKRQIVSGNSSLDYKFAKRTKNTLRDLSIRSTQFQNNQNSMTAGIINDYLLDPRPHVWYESKMHLGIIIKSGSDMLQEWQAQHSDLLDESQKQLLSTLSKRMDILKKLEQMEPPVTEEELSALNQVNQKYRNLIDQFHTTTHELNTYINKNET